MKKIIYFLFVISFIYTYAVEETPFQTKEEFNPRTIEKLELPKQEIPKDSSVVVYGKLGTSIDYQRMGIGIRKKTSSKKWAHDVSLNLLHLPLDSHIMPDMSDEQGFFPTVEYSFLHYGKKNRYFGVGNEFIFLSSMNEDFSVLLNPKLIWGKQWTKRSFGQISFNLTPAFGLVMGMMLFPNSGDNPLEIGAELISLFDITIGF